MRREIIRYRWVFVVTMFLFLFYHQLIGFLVEPLTMVFREISSVSDLWLNIELPLDIIFALIFFLVWGILFDSHSRRRLISLAGFLWGVSAWLMALAPTFALFNVSKAISGVDRASHSGIYAMVGDLFKPTNRGKILGLLLLAQPLALLFAVILSDRLEDMLQWRSVFLMLGAIGFLLALMIHNFVKEPKRGAKEPALGDVEMTGTYQFDWDLAKTAITKPGLILMCVYIFFGMIPWIVMSDGMLNYLRALNGFEPLDIYLILLPIMFGITLGYPIGGLLGDALFRFKKNGRLLISLVGVIAPSICLYYAFRGQNVQGQGFLVSILLMGFFMAFPWSNIFASVMDITLPELRASAFGLALVFQTVSVLVSPLILSLGQRTVGLIDTIVWLSIGAWAICLVILVLLLIFVPRDIEKLRRHMAYRSHLEVRLQKEKHR
jgi:MFS family permease